MDIIADRLKSLRSERKLLQDDVASRLNIARATYASYENGTNPSVETLMLMAKFFNVTTDYLVGLSNEKRVGDDIRKLFSDAASVIGTSAPSSDDTAQQLRALISYYRSGAPCGDIPARVIINFTLSMAALLRAAAYRDFPAALDNANAVAVTALEITKMPAMLLINQEEDQLESK